MQEKEYRCSKCKEVKTKEEMSLDATKRGGVSSWCRICRSYSTKAWTVKNTDRLKVASKKKREDGYDYWKNRNYTLSYRYGLSLEKYDEMKKGQDDKCKICGKDSNEMTYHLFVDHNHKTGKVRGLLCSPCNAFIGHLKDDVNLIQRAIDYLKES